MSEIRYDHALEMNSNLDSPHAGAASSASSDGALHASSSGATYEGSAAADASHSAALPSTPDLSGAAAHAQGTVDATVGDATAHAGAALDTAAGLPELPELDTAAEASLDASASIDGGSLGLDVMLSSFVSTLGDLMVTLSGSLSALAGF